MSPAFDPNTAAPGLAPPAPADGEPRPRRRAGLLGALAALAALFAGGGCDDPTCIFVGTCDEEGDGPGEGAMGDEEATLPHDGERISISMPRSLTVYPDDSAPADGVAGTTPVLVVFSETMNPGTVTLGTVEIVPAGAGGGPVDVDAVLTGDGCVLVLLPTAPLDAGDYTVRVPQGAIVTDSQGQTLFPPTDDMDVVFGSFTVAMDDPDEVTLVGAVPRDEADDESQRGPLVVAFDRAVDLATVDDASFDVKLVGTGMMQQPPEEDPEPEALTVGSAQDSRVLVWRSEDAFGEPVPLGPSETVTLTLDASIRAAGGMETLGSDQTVTFTTADFDAPLAASIQSTPPDAIGNANLDEMQDPLRIEVDVPDAMEGDRVDAFFFGNDPGQEDPFLQAFFRPLLLEAAGPASFDLEVLDLFGDDGNPRVTDGAVSFAFRMRRGGIESPLKVLDVDLLQPDIQDPVLDTMAPEVEELANPGGTTAAYRSDVRDLVIAGRANELVRAVEVDVDEGTLPPDNGDGMPAALGSGADGRFLAAPVPVGILPPDIAEVSFDFVVYDAAGNASQAVPGAVFTQLGAVGGAGEGFTPGDVLEVQVFDARTLEPIEDALVVTHSDEGTGTDFPMVMPSGSATTGPDGRASVATAPAPSVGALLTVDAGGYDLFTFHGVPAARVSVGLTPTGATASASLAGQVVPATELGRVSFQLGILSSRLADPRLPDDVPRTFEAGTCSADGTECPFRTQAISPHGLGAVSLVVGDFDEDDPEDLVQGFELVVPRLGTDPGATDQLTVTVPFLFEEVEDEEEQPVELALTLDASGLGFLADPDPEVTVETLVPGIPGSVVVGLGLADGPVGDVWDVRAAYAGAVSNGFFAENGTTDPVPWLRVELCDADGNRSVRRPRSSALASDPDPPSVLAAQPPPQLSMPMPMGSSGGTSYELLFDDVLPDALGLAGLYRARLVDSGGTGRGWDLWRVDPPDAVEPVVVHVPDLGPGRGLADGTITCVLESHAWEGFDATAFLWSDLERERDVFTRAAPVEFTQQP